MLSLDEMLEQSNGMVPEAIAYSFLDLTQNDVLETFESLLGELISVQNFAQFRKAVSDKKDGIEQLLADRARAREIIGAE